MATTKAAEAKKRSDAAKKAARTRARNESKQADSTRPEPFTDLNTQADDQVTPGGWAEVVAGPHKGKFGAVLEATGKDEIVIRTRDDNAERIVVAYADARPASVGDRREGRHAAG